MKNRRGPTANHMLSRWWFVNGGGWLLSTEVVDVNRPVPLSSDEALKGCGSQQGWRLLL